MQRQTKPTQAARLKKMKAQVTRLQSELSKIKGVGSPLRVKLGKTQQRFKKIKNPAGPDTGVGEFLLYIDVTAVSEAVYVPLSIASGKKPAGFVYQIEGTKSGSISTTDITVRGAGVTHITLGTIRYVKIPAGKNATFRIRIEMRGQMQHAYAITIIRINYKADPEAARYIPLNPNITTKTLTMR